MSSRTSAMSPRRRQPATTDELRRSLVEHAKHIVVRDGPSALTMRALASEAGCALGLPYKVFEDRRALLLEILRSEFIRLDEARHDLLTRVGAYTVGGNLTWYAERLLSAASVALAREVTSDDELVAAFAADVHGSGVGPGSFESAFAGYLSAEKEVGRVAVDVDVDAFGFLLAGAVHNLIMSGDPYPRPTSQRLRAHLDATATAIAPR